MSQEDASISLYDLGASIIEGAPPDLLPILGGLAGVLLLIGAPILMLEVWRLHRAGGLTWLDTGCGGGGGVCVCRVGAGSRVSGNETQD
jgi:hypothetical protein